MDYLLRIQITTLDNPDSGQPNAGTPDTILDQTIDLGQWVADRNANVTAMALAELPPPDEAGV